MHKYVNEMKIITNNAVSAIEHHDIQTLATMMTISQKYFDEYCQPNCSTELKSPCLHRLINDMKLKTISLAVKGVGSQGDGSAQILCKNATQQREVKNPFYCLFIDVMYIIFGFYLITCILFEKIYICLYIIF